MPMFATGGAAVSGTVRTLRRLTIVHGDDCLETLMTDYNAGIIEEFRSNGGKVGGAFAGAPLLLLHHVGRKSGKEHVAPVMYQPDPDDEATVYVFASKGGAPTDPEWYRNTTEAGRASIEIGGAVFDVTVSEVRGADRDEIYRQQALRYPGFAEYAEKTAGIRLIPVLALTRA